MSLHSFLGQQRSVGSGAAWALGQCLWELTGESRMSADDALKRLTASPAPLLGYRWGGAGWGPMVDPSGDVDCSGFVSAVGQRVGVLPLDIRLTTGTIPLVLDEVTQCRPGDLALFSGHVGFVLVPGKLLLESHGEGRASTNEGRVGAVKWGQRPIKSYWRFPSRVGEHQGPRLWQAHVDGAPLDTLLSRASWRPLHDGQRPTGVDP